MLLLKQTHMSNGLALSNFQRWSAQRNRKTDLNQEITNHSTRSTIMKQGNSAPQEHKTTHRDTEASTMLGVGGGNQKFSSKNDQLPEKEYRQIDGFHACP